MKRLMILLAIVMVGFVACENKGNDATPEEKTRTVNFTTSTFEITKEKLKAATPLRNSVKFLNLIILKDNKVISSIKKSAYNKDGSVSDTFGKFSLLLKDGNYRILCIGTNWDKDNAPDVYHYVDNKEKDNYICKSDNCDVFLYNEHVVVSEDGKSYEMVMNRIVSKINFNLLDYNKAPKEASKVNISVDEYVNYFYMLDSHYSSTSGISRGHAFATLKKSKDGSVAQETPVYVFAPKKETTTTARIDVYNEKNEVIGYREIEIPLQRNCLVNLKGNIFGVTDHGQNFNIDVVSDFSNTQNKNF